jgi:hypothetical protein
MTYRYIEVSVIEVSVIQTHKEALIYIGLRHTYIYIHRGLI